MVQVYSIDSEIIGPSKLCNDTVVEIKEGRKEPRVKGTFCINFMLIWRAASGEGRVWQKKWKLKDQIGQFESWWTNLTLGAKLRKMIRIGGLHPDYNMPNSNWYRSLIPCILMETVQWTFSFQNSCILENIGQFISIFFCSIF